MGATICNQEEADGDIPKLLAAPAAVCFLSCEPLVARQLATPAKSASTSRGQPRARDRIHTHREAPVVAVGGHVTAQPSFDGRADLVCDCRADDKSMRQLFLYAVIVLGSMAAASVLHSCAGDQRPSAPSYLPDNKH
jgi:hypothetical protein